MSRPRFTVIVPAHDAGRTLRRCLMAIEASGLSRQKIELVVVDDASRDDTSAIATQYADALIRLPDVPRGPSYARNRGAEIAHGELLLFVDADVALPPDLLERISRLFDERPTMDAAIGRYMRAAGPATLPTWYHNVRCHYLHGLVAGEVSGFWGACGAVRAEAFAAAGRFNEWHFSAPPVEDVELGRRMVQRGLCIELHPGLEVRHLRQWSLRQLLGRDCWQRGLRVARLLGDATVRPRRAGQLPGRVSRELGLVALVLLAAVAGAVAATGDGTTARVALALLLASIASVLLLEARFLAYLTGSVGIVRGLALAPLHVLCELASGAGVVAGWALSHLIGHPRPDSTVDALAEVGVRTWPPLPTRR